MAGAFKLALLQFPSGRWGFVGSVPMKLALVTKDGKTPTEKQFADAAQVGPRIAGLKERAWKTKEAALKAAKKEGYSKSKISVHPRTKNPYLGDAVELAKKKRKTPPPLPKHLRGRKKNPSVTSGLRRIEKKGDYEVWMGPSGNAEFPVRSVLLRRGEIVSVTESIGQVARKWAMSEFRAITHGAGPRAPRAKKKKRGSKNPTKNPKARKSARVSVRSLVAKATK